jgi:hypothetical protein
MLAQHLHHAVTSMLSAGEHACLIRPATHATRPLVSPPVAESPTNYAATTVPLTSGMVQQTDCT